MRLFQFADDDLFELTRRLTRSGAIDEQRVVEVTQSLMCGRPKGLKPHQLVEVYERARVAYWNHFDCGGMNREVACRHALLVAQVYLEGVLHLVPKLRYWDLPAMLGYPASAHPIVVHPRPRLDV